MFDSALAFTRYRLEVVKTWPDGEVKEELLAAIEASLRREGQAQNVGPGNPRPPIGQDSATPLPPQFHN